VFDSETFRVLTETHVELTPSDGAPDLVFGEGAFTDGTTAIVGATATDGLSPGFTYLYTKTPGGFVEQTKLTTGQPFLASSFGEHVAVQGNTAIVSSYSYAYVLESDGTTWSPSAEIPGESPVGGVNAVAIDGDRIALGMTTLGPDGGNVRVLNRNGSQWTLETTLVADDPTPTPFFGAPLVLHGDLLLVAAAGDYNPVSAIGDEPPGAVYVYRRDTAGWVRTQKLDASDSSPGDLFGASIAYDGTTLVVGAPGADAAAEDNGAVYVFTDTGGGFVEQSHISVFPSAHDTNGWRVAVSGNRLCNAPYEGPFPGIIEVFQLEAGVWEPALVVQPANVVGLGISLSLQGDTLVAGAEGKAFAVTIQADGVCTPDGASVDLGNGELTSCAPYTCAAGACGTSCTDTTACASGFVCDREKGQGTCVPNSGSAAVSADSGGCRVAVGPGAHAWWVVCLALFLLRRKQRTACKVA
jgi:hypothetical protein